MRHQFWIITDTRIRRDRRGRKYRVHKRCCQRGELCLVGEELSLNGQVAKLMPMPARVLLALMVCRPNISLTEEELLANVYETPDLEADGNPISVYLSKAREALRAVGGPEIKNHRPHGWTLS